MSTLFSVSIKYRVETTCEKCFFRLPCTFFFLPYISSRTANTRLCPWNCCSSSRSPLYCTRNRTWDFLFPTLRRSCRFSPSGPLQREITKPSADNNRSNVRTKREPGTCLGRSDSSLKYVWHTRIRQLVSVVIIKFGTRRTCVRTATVSTNSIVVIFGLIRSYSTNLVKRRPNMINYASSLIF